MAGFCSAHKDYEKGCNTCQTAKKLNEATCLDCGMEPCNCDPTEQTGSDSALSDGLSLPDYKQAYSYASNFMQNDTKLWEMQNGATTLDWDTIRDRLADAYMAGVEAAR